MAKLFDQAHTWIMHQHQADAKGRKESAAGSRLNRIPVGGMPPAAFILNHQLYMFTVILAIRWFFRFSSCPPV